MYTQQKENKEDEHEYEQRKKNVIKRLTYIKHSF